MKHYYEDGTWSKPWYCRRCHPVWYYGSAFMLGVIFWSMTALFLLLLGL